MVLHVEPMPALTGVTLLSMDATLPRPHVALVGALHGNERCGLLALERLQEELRSGVLPLTAGTVVLVHGNPEATRERRRHTQHGHDLNRMFDYRFVEELAPALWQVEHHRALALRPLIEDLDALLDLHSATSPTPPFAIASRVPASEQLALALDLDYVTLGWDGPGLLEDRVLLGPLTRRERPSVAVECGQHDDPEAVEIAHSCARRALMHFGMLAPELPRRSAPAKVLRIRAAIKRPSASFRFEKPIVGMQPLARGEVIGHGDHLVLSVRNPCFAVMPNDGVAVGEDMLYIAESVEP